MKNECEKGESFREINHLSYFIFKVDVGYEEMNRK